MKVLVTGGSGLIGMALRPMLADRGHQVVACDVTDFGRGDHDLVLARLDDAAALERIVTDNAVDAIVHCGAISGPMLAVGDPLTVVETNIGGTARLLDIARRHQLRRFVFCSSIGVYGNAGNAAITEETPRRPTSVYGASKVAGEALVDAFVAEYGLSAVSLRPSRVYGPYRRGNCFIRDILRDARDGRITRIPCDTAFPFHYIHVDDVAASLVLALEAERLPHQVYLVDAMAPMTMPEIVAIARTVLPQARIELVPGSDVVADVQTSFDTRLIAADLGWRPRYDLAAGIRRYAETLPSDAMLGR